MTQHKPFPTRLLRGAVDLARPAELPYEQPFPGAACCQLAELVTYKAAPLQDSTTPFLRPYRNESIRRAVF